MDAPVVADLRALGVRLGFRSEVGRIGISTILRDTSEWTPEFSLRVREALSRHGLVELREGVYGAPETDAEALRRWEESARDAAEYGDIYRTMAEHPDWSDQEIADSTGADPDDIAYYRAEWGR